jgi:hypothetical protein
MKDDTSDKGDAEREGKGDEPLLDEEDSEVDIWMRRIVQYSRMQRNRGVKRIL